MSILDTASIRLGVVDKNSDYPTTPILWYNLSPGCSIQQTVTKDLIDISIPEINSFIEDLGLTTNDTITLNTKLTYDHNNEPPFLTIKKLIWNVKHRKESGVTTSKDFGYILQIGGTAIQYRSITIDKSADQLYYPDDWSFYVMVQEVSYNYEPGGDMVDLTLRLKVTNTHDRAKSP